MTERPVLFLGVLAILSSACAKEVLTEKGLGDGKQLKAATQITAYYADDDSKTVLAEDGVTILWSPGDEISVFYGSTGAKFTAMNSTPESKTIFASEKSLIFGGLESGEDYLWSVYPYSESNSMNGGYAKMMIPTLQCAKDSSFAPGMFPAIGRAKSTSIPFYNVCGGVRFSLSDPEGVKSVMFMGNNGEVLCGRASVGFGTDGYPYVASVENGLKSVSLSAPEGGFKSGKWYYISLLPGTLERGFKMYFFKDDSYTVKEVSSKVPVIRSRFGQLENADAGLVPAYYTGTDLSSAATANCYIVNQPGDYRFSVATKGNGSESVGAVSSAEVLWESFGTEETPAVGSLVDYVFTDGDYAYFKAPQDFKNGNAVIAAKDSLGKVLWSWHIWLCKDYDPEASAQVYHNQAGTFLDRNLGATSATPGDIRTMGLMYQVHRKDPFLNAGTLITEDVLDYPQAASTAIWPEQVESTVENDRHSFLDANPMTYLTGFRKLDLEGKWTVPGSAKSVNDPCPAGWRIPDGDSWACAFGMPLDSISAPFDGSNHGWDFGGTSPLSCGDAQGIWYPTNGYIQLLDGRLHNCHSHGTYIGVDSSSKTYTGAMRICGSKYLSRTSSYCLSYAIRCVSESSPAIIKVDSVKTDDIESFILTNGEKRQLSAKCFPESANVTKVFWTSSDSTVAKVSSDGLVTALKAGTCTVVAKSYNNTSVKFNVRVVEEIPEGAVNLGLSVLWAEKNLGADKPEGLGGYYAWGEVSEKATYSWSNYVHCNGTDSSLTKYNQNPSLGIVDSIQKIQLSDDAAYQLTKGEWRMPATSHIHQLLDNTDREWIEINGVYGYKFTSRIEGYTGKWIFIPAAGAASGDAIVDRNINGRYWSRSMTRSEQRNGVCLWFDSGTCKTSGKSRYLGYSIRPIYNL